MTSYGEFAVCNAPWNNMYFTVTGRASPCWKLPAFCDAWSEDRSIKDIWTGDKFNQYREALKQNTFLNRCQECKKDIDNNVWPLAKAYQEYSVKEYPTLMELELSNQCNLECTMCSGYLSSGIRKNREKLPPLISPYNQLFVDQLREFVPHLEELRFNGGEPFAQSIVLDICDMVAEVNPKLKINIATNGTVYNKRVKHILENNNIHLNISIDSLDPSRYAEIRINGNFDQLMKNFNTFNEYCKTNDRLLSIMVNPMRNNWQEMIDFVKFTDEYQVELWYNTILYPHNLAIKTLPADELKEVYEGMKAQLNDLPTTAKNYNTFKHLVENQIAMWLLDKYEE